MSELQREAALGIAMTVGICALALFGAAGTLSFARAWCFLAVFTAAVVAITADLLVRDPALLRRRLAVGVGAEREPRQKLIVAAGDLAFVAIFVVAGLDRRFGWSDVPGALVAAGDALVALGLALVAWVFRANTFASGNIAVEGGQRLVRSGPYALVRHPMYAGALVMLFGTALALGAWPALVPATALAALIVWRLIDEERVLRASLDGYDAYTRDVRWRLVPGVW